MTTYILHGGVTRTNVPSNHDFYKLMANLLPANGTWLGVYFASENEEDAVQTFTDQQRLMREAGVKSECVMAVEENFPTQFAQADVIYFNGGKTEKLMNIMRQWPLSVKWLKTPNKVIAGSSAGAYMLGRDYMSQFDGFGEGFGILPYGMVAHHGAEKFQPQQNFTTRQRPLLMLHEAQFCVIEI